MIAYVFPEPAEALYMVNPDKSLKFESKVNCFSGTIAMVAETLHDFSHYFHCIYHISFYICAQYD